MTSKDETNILEEWEVDSKPKQYAFKMRCTCGSVRELMILDNPRLNIEFYVLDKDSFHQEIKPSNKIIFLCDKCGKRFELYLEEIKK